jgi:hypothetical protein
VLLGLVFESAHHQVFESINRQRCIQNLLQQSRIPPVQCPGVPVQMQQSAVGVLAQQLREQWQFITRHTPIDKALREAIKR